MVVLATVVSSSSHSIDSLSPLQQTCSIALSNHKSKHGGSAPSLDRHYQAFEDESVKRQEHVPVDSAY
jgi:hypothetical protein